MTRRSKLDYFPFFPKDAAADEAFSLMDDTQLGFWLRLMCFQWPNGSVPADPDTLRRGLNGTAPGGTQRTAEYIAAMLSGPVGSRMKPHPELPGRLADPRLLLERSIAENVSGRNSKNRKSCDEDTESRATKPQSENNESSNVGSVSVSVSVYNSSEVEPSEAFELLWGKHPKKKEQYLAQQYFADLIGNQPDLWPAIASGHASYLRSEEATKENGKYVMGLARFLAERRWSDDWGQAQPATAAPKPWQPPDWSKD